MVFFRLFRKKFDLYPATIKASKMARSCWAQVSSFLMLPTLVLMPSWWCFWFIWDWDPAMEYATEPLRPQVNFNLKTVFFVKRSSEEFQWMSNNWCLFVHLRSFSCNICIHSSGRISFLRFCSLSFQKKLAQQIPANLFQNAQIQKKLTIRLWKMAGTQKKLHLPKTLDFQALSGIRFRVFRVSVSRVFLIRL